jgi:hypothetical protein
MEPLECAKKTLTRVAARLEQFNRECIALQRNSDTINECIRDIDLAFALIDGDFEMAWRLEREASEKK